MFVDVLMVHDMAVIHNVMASYPETGAPGCKKSDYGHGAHFTVTSGMCLTLQGQI